jgi:hypothetical protein
MTLDPNAQLLAEVEQLLVRQSELFRQLVDSGVLGQRGSLALSKFLRSPSGQRLSVSRSRTGSDELSSDALDVVPVNRRPQRLGEGTAPDGELEARERPGTQPSTPAGQCTTDRQ